MFEKISRKNWKNFKENLKKYRGKCGKILRANFINFQENLRKY